MIDLMMKISKNIAIVGVSKTRNVDEIKKAVGSGIKIIGENKIQEAEEKYILLKDFFKIKKVEFHFIGHLQKNKVKKAVEMFALIQSIDSIELGIEIDKRAREINKSQEILIQINIGNEEQKSGIRKEEVFLLIEKINALKNLKLKGLMCIAPYFEDKEKTRPYFREMKKLFDESKLEILSMGMSEDYKIAIDEGSNMIRLGRALFGERV